jgi:O-antigen/teichoic acid export membrane protein
MNPEKTSSITERALKNISYSVLSYGWPVIIAIFITPLIVHKLGIKGYGIYIFINTLITLAGLLDIGISTALSKFIAERHGRRDSEGLGRLFGTGNIILLAIGVAGFIFISGSIFVGLVSFPGTAGEYSAYIPAFIFAGFTFFINSINTLYIILPMALQRFDVGIKIGLYSITLQQLTTLALLFMGRSINSIFLAQALLTLIFYFIYRKYSVVLLNEDEQKSVHKYAWHKKEALTCYTFGIVTFFNNLAGSSLTYLDRMIVPVFLGPSNLTYYSLPGSITNKTPGFSATLSGIIFPMTATFEGAGEKDKIKILYVRSMRLITITSAAITITFMAFAYKMLNYWISPDLANKASAVLIILALTNFVLAITGPLSNFLLGMGKLRSLTIASVVTAVFNLVLLLVLLPRFGIEGAAWAYLLALVPYLFLFYRTERVYLALLDRKDYYLKILLQISCTSTVVYLIDAFIVERFISNFPGVIVSCIFSFALFLGVHYMFGFFEKEDVHDIGSFVRRLLRR